METAASVLVLVMGFIMLSAAVMTTVRINERETQEAAKEQVPEAYSYDREEVYRTAEKPERDMRSVTLTVSFDQNYQEEEALTVYSGQFYGGTMQSNGVTPPEPDQRTGYEFVEWRDTSGKAFQSTETVEKDMMYRAVWTEDPSATVSYHANGGQFKGGPYTDLLPAKVLDSSILAERDWDVFTGWNTAWDGTGKEYQPGDTIDGEEKVTLYAQWNGLRLITFVPNGGTFKTSGFKNPVKVELGKTVEEPKIEKLGYTFDGWYETEITPFKFDFNEPVTRDVVLYARWLEDNTKIRIGLINDTTTIGIWELSEGETSLGKDTNGDSYSKKKPTKSGYSLYGWYTTKDGKGVQILDASGSIVKENWEKLPKPDETLRYTPLYACWKSSSKQNAVDMTAKAVALTSGSTYLIALDDTISKAAYRNSGAIQSDDEFMSTTAYFDMTNGNSLKVVADSPVSGKNKAWIATKVDSETEQEQTYYYLSSGSSSSSSSLYLASVDGEIKAVSMSTLPEPESAMWYMDTSGMLRNAGGGFLSYSATVRDKETGNNPLYLSEAATAPVTLFEVKEQTVYTFSK